MGDNRPRASAAARKLSLMVAAHANALADEARRQENACCWLVEGAESLRLDLGHLAVIREQAVDLALHIGGLRVDARSDAAALEVEQPGGRLAVTRDRQPVAAVLAHHLDEVFVVAGRVKWEVGVGVGVLVGHVTNGPEVTAARRVDQARGVPTCQPLRHLYRVVLTPRLVERHPDQHAGVVVKHAYHGFELLHELSVRRLAPATLHRRGIHPRPWREHLHRRALGRPRGGVKARRLVLPHQHAQPVAVVVPARGLDLDVLADHVEAARLGKLDVIPHRGIARWREQSVRPPPLVKGTQLEARRAVESDP
eukprot:scaffold46996_cov60-Phaeocystis_antarctica.AAC.2